MGVLCAKAGLKDRRKNIARCQICRGLMDHSGKGRPRKYCERCKIEISRKNAKKWQKEHRVEMNRIKREYRKRQQRNPYATQ